MTRRASLRRVHRERLRGWREERVAPGESIPGPDDLVEREWSRRYLRQAVAGLDEPYSEVIRMRYLEDLSAREVAEQRGTAEATVGSQSKRGLTLSGTRLEKEYGTGRALGLALIFAFEWKSGDLPPDRSTCAVLARRPHCRRRDPSAKRNATA